MSSFYSEHTTTKSVLMCIERLTRLMAALETEKATEQETPESDPPEFFSMRYGKLKKEDEDVKECFYKVIQTAQNQDSLSSIVQAAGGTIYMDLDYEPPEPQLLCEELDITQVDRSALIQAAMEFFYPKQKFEPAFEDMENSKYCYKTPSAGSFISLYIFGFENFGDPDKMSLLKEKTLKENEERDPEDWKGDSYIFERQIASTTGCINLLLNGKFQISDKELQDIKKHVTEKEDVSAWTYDEFARNTADFAHSLTLERPEQEIIDVMSHGSPEPGDKPSYTMKTERRHWPKTPLTTFIQEKGMTVYDYHQKWVNNERIICSGINFSPGKHSFDKDINPLIPIAIKEIHPNATNIRRAYPITLTVARMCWAATIKQKEIMFFFNYGREKTTEDGHIFYLIMTQVEIHGISIDEILEKYVKASESKGTNLNNLKDEGRFCQDLFYQARIEMKRLKGATTNKRR